jgi:hypothetical protein
VKFYICFLIPDLERSPARGNKKNTAKTGVVLAGALTFEPSSTLTKILNRAVPTVVTAKS